jgi:hypothetical protein
MRRFTNGNPEMWDQLDEERSDSAFVKTASVEVTDIEGPWAGPRLPPGFAVKTAGCHLRIPAAPRADAPDWAMDAYNAEFGETMQKVAGFWADAWKNFSGTIAGAFRGSAGDVATHTPDSILKTIGSGAMAGTESDQLKALKPLAKEMAGLAKKVQSANKGFGRAQLGLAIGIPALAGFGAYHLWSKGKRRRQHAAVEHLLLKQPEFENLADREQVVGEAYGTMRKYAPSIASDPIVAKSFVGLLVSHPDQQNIEVIQNLMEAEKKFRDAGEFSRDWHDISKIVRHPLATALGGGGKS